MGARAGQVYAVEGPDGEPKGEIAIFETAESYSLANALRGGLGRLAAGDRLNFARAEAPTLGAKAALSETADDWPKLQFLKAVSRLADGGATLTAALISVDDGEKLEALVGPAEMARRRERIRAAAGASQPLEAAVDWDGATLAAVWLLGQEGWPPVLEALKANLDFPVSLGLASWPSPVLRPDGLLAAAQKALLEASMTGPAQAIAFGPQCLNISGDRLFEAGDLEGARDEYSRGLTLDPGRLNLLNSLGVCHGRLGDHHAALRAFNEALAQDPENLMALFNKGCSLVMAGRQEEALETLKMAAANPAAGFEALYQYGRLALELDRLGEALPALRRAAGHKDRRGSVHRLLGQAELLAGEAQKALEAFKKAVKNDPDDAQSLSSLGVLFLERNNDREVALSLFQRSVELDPTNSLFRQRLGKLLFDQGDFSGASHHLRAAINYGCQTLDVRRRLEEAQYQEDDLEGYLAGELGSEPEGEPPAESLTPGQLSDRRA
jgi:tetratricopeptide (TPR) repeat protein